MELGDQGPGVACAEPAVAANCSPLTGGTVAVGLGVGAFGLGALGQHLGVWLLRLGAA
jgi:hypothetical protein